MPHLSSHAETRMSKSQDIQVQAPGREMLPPVVLLVTPAAVGLFARSRQKNMGV